MFIYNADNEDKKTEGKKVMMWGIIALFVMLFVWQIINILANTFFKNIHITGIYKVISNILYYLYKLKFIGRLLIINHLLFI